MSTSDDPLPVPWRTKRAIAGAAAALASVFSCVLAVPAAASPQPKYSLSVVEGETTQPEDVIAHTSASAEHAGEVVVSIVRGGITVYRDSGSSGAWLSQVPQVGDVVTLESPAGRLIGSEVYDGLPSIDPTVCAGSVNFSGTRSAGETVEGGYFSVSPRPYFRRTSSGQAQVDLALRYELRRQLPNQPDARGDGVRERVPGNVARRVARSSPIRAKMTALSEPARRRHPRRRPPPPPPPPPSPLLQGSILKLSHTTIRALLKSGWRDVVGDQPAGHRHAGPLPRRRQDPRLCHQHAPEARGAAARTRHRHRQDGRHRHPSAPSDQARTREAQIGEKRARRAADHAAKRNRGQTGAGTTLGHAPSLAARASPGSYSG